MSDPLTLQKLLATKALSQPDAGRFFECLQAELGGAGIQPEAFRTPEAAVDLFTTWQVDPIQRPFWTICAALHAFDKTPVVPGSARAAARHAAVALYVLAACRLVNRAARARDGYAIRVELNEPIICAVIATALFGGELHLKPVEGDVPRADHVYLVKPSVGGEHEEAEFERALFLAFFQNDARAPEIGLDGGQWRPGQREDLYARLRARLGNIRHARKSCLALVIDGQAGHEPAVKFAATHSVPVFLRDDAVGHDLLGMPEMDLRAEIVQFWSDLMAMDRSAAAPERPQASEKGGETMSKGGTTVNFYGPAREVTLAADHSLAQRGDHASAVIASQVGTDATSLAQALKELLASINEQKSSATRDELIGHTETAVAEAGKAGPDRGRIQKALDAVKALVEKGAGILEGGQKIFDLLDRAYKAL
ncbi:MAG: hypothetical protein GC191_20035 [Azospirillum sp.]|nr:hypothetical protein [Azospirillum sp.]